LISKKFLRFALPAAARRSPEDIYSPSHAGKFRTVLLRGKFISSCSLSDRDTAVAGFAEGLQVAFIVRPAVGQRLDVVNLLSRGQAAFAPAALAKRILRDISCPSFAPSLAVPPIRFGVAAILVVPRRVLFRVPPAVPAIGQFRAALPGAWFRGLSRHRITCLTNLDNTIIPQSAGNGSG